MSSAALTYGIGPRPSSWVPPVKVKVHHSVNDGDKRACHQFFEKWHEQWGSNVLLPQSGEGYQKACWDELLDLLWSRQLSINQVKAQLRDFKRMTYPQLAQSATELRLSFQGKDAIRAKLDARVGNLDALANEVIMLLEADTTCTTAPTALWASETVKWLRQGLTLAAIDYANALTETLTDTVAFKTSALLCNERAFEERRIDQRDIDAAECNVNDSRELTPSNSTTHVRRVAEALWQVLQKQAVPAPGHYRLTPFALILRLQIITHMVWAKKLCDVEELAADLPSDPDPDSNHNQSRQLCRDTWWRLRLAVVPGSSTLSARAETLYYIAGYLHVAVARQIANPNCQEHATFLRDWIALNKIDAPSAVQDNLPAAKATARSGKTAEPA